MFLEKSSPKVTTDAVVEALANAHDRRILALSQDEPVEARKIIDETDIPKSTVYRRLQVLVEKGLLEVADGRMHNGHAVERYRSRLTRASLVIDDGDLEARWDLRDEDAPAPGPSGAYDPDGLTDVEPVSGPEEKAQVG